MEYRELYTWTKAAKLKKLRCEINERVNLRNALYGESQSYSNQINELEMQIAALEGNLEKIHQDNWEDLKQIKRG